MLAGMHFRSGGRPCVSLIFDGVTATDDGLEPFHRIVENGLELFRRIVEIWS
jgi:hypothetical protein